MKHQYWLKNLSAYVDNELSETKRRKIERHLSECALCRDKLTAWQKIHKVYTEESELTPEPELWQTISHRLRTEQFQPLHVWEDERILKWLPNPLPALATVVVVIFFVFIAQSYLTPGEKTDISLDSYLTKDTELSASSGLEILIPSSETKTEGAS
ncbi:MAG: zf-HC2 domain-containing protein [bacterium]|nr:zf-HC2 domain-containing protein [bacterium]